MRMDNQGFSDHEQPCIAANSMHLCSLTLLHLQFVTSKDYELATNVRAEH